MSEPRPGRCWYCGGTRLRTDDPPEHIILAVFGGTLTTDKVCRVCNERAGSKIDWALQNDFVLAQTKLLHGVKNARRKASGKGRIGQVEAHITGAPDAKVDLDKNFRPKLRPRIVEGEREGEFTVSAGSEEEARKLAERHLRRIKHEAVHKEVKRDSFNEITIGYSVTGALWTRALAKMTLATLSLCVSEEWLDTDESQRFQRWLWEEQPLYDDGSPADAWPVESHEAERLVGVPPTHLVTVMPITDERVLVSFGLFGVYYLRAGVTVGKSTPRDCWIIEPGKESRRMSFGELINLATQKFIEEQGVEYPES